LEGVKEEDEASDENRKKVDREKIDRFGNKVDPNAEKEVRIVLPKPEMGMINEEMEEEIEEEDADEWSKKMKELAYLRAKKKAGKEWSN
jgi:hypothetical protein